MGFCSRGLRSGSTLNTTKTSRDLYLRSRVGGKWMKNY